MVHWISFGLGLIIGLVCAAIFALILHRIADSDPQGAITHLRQLLVTILGGGLSDYAIFDFLLRSGAITYYVAGFIVSFLPFSAIAFVEWFFRFLRGRPHDV